MNKYNISQQFCILLILLNEVNSVKIFLMGGAMQDNQTSVYNIFAKSCNGQPFPNQCDSNWNLTKCPRIAVITSAAATQSDGNDAYEHDTSSSLSYYHLFTKYGFSPQHITVHIDNFVIDSDPKTNQGQKNLEILQQCDAVFFNGGDQARHARSWMDDNGKFNALLQIIKNRMQKDEIVLAGTSAGTMIMSQQTFGSGSAFGVLYFAQSKGLAPKSVSDGAVGGSGLSDVRNGTHGLQYQENAGKMPGFNFVNFQTDTHFDARSRLGRLIPSLIDLKMSIGVGVDESTCLYYNNGIGQVLGLNGVFIVDVSDARKGSQSYFTINDVIVNYLTQGDTFNFINNKLTSSKDLIQNPYYKSHCDSDNIFTSYQITLLTTRLIDQKQTYNIGRTKKPSSYPSQTPQFKINFQKSLSTKGYYSNSTKKYTSQAVVVTYNYINQNILLQQ